MRLSVISFLRVLIELYLLKNCIILQIHYILKTLSSPLKKANSLIMIAVSLDRLIVLFDMICDESLLLEP